MTTEMTSAALLGRLERDARPGTTLIAKRFTFDAAHVLPNVPEGHKCGRVHGHTYTVKVYLRGPVTDVEGWIVDFGDLKGRWKPIEQRLDHHMLNELPGLENPTAEVLAAWIATELDADGPLAADVQVAAVEVAETPDSSAIFFPETASAPPGVLAPPTARLAESRRDPWRDAPMEDVQGRQDDRGIALDEVGVRNVRLPIEVLDRERSSQPTVGVLTLGVDVPAAVKGTHMSRFLEAVADHQGPMTLFTLAHLTQDLRRRLEGGTVRAEVTFPYFVRKAAPVTGAVGPVDLDCAFEVLDREGDLRYRLRVAAPVTTVCPCSRDISEYGAHNQRGLVTVMLELETDVSGQPEMLWIEELVELADEAASSPVYSVVKRPDERHMTMAGYDKPRFVEDVAREMALALDIDRRIAGYEVTVVNDESIHPHDAYAVVRSANWVT